MIEDRPMSDSLSTENELVANLREEARVPKEQTETQNNTTNGTGARLLGDVVSLLMQSPAHRHLFLADLDWMIGPPLALRQFKLFHDGKKPLALALWASVSDDVDKMLAQGQTRLRPTDWKSGKNLWLIELIVPGSKQDPKITQRVLGELTKTIFSGKTIKVRGTDQKTGKPRVVEIGPKPSERDLKDVSSSAREAPSLN